MIRLTAAGFTAALAIALAAAAAADPADLSDPDTWPVADTAAYSTAEDPGWVFFVPDIYGPGCGIGPDGEVGCDIVVRRNENGTVKQDYGPPGPVGFYKCDSPGQNPSRCPLPPPGANQVVAGPSEPARYVKSASPTFTRAVEELPPGYRLVNGGTTCYVSGASPGGVNCETSDGNGFLWSVWGGILEPTG